MTDDSRKRGVLRGHMSRARSSLRRNLRLVDAVLEVADARIPETSRHPKLRRWTQPKPVITALNKVDLADPEKTEAWLHWYDARRQLVVPVNARTGEGRDVLVETVRGLRRPPEGDRQRPLRLLAAGLPNVGKSSLLNRLAGERRAQTGAAPGITRGEQWISAGRGLQLLDLPGILEPALGAGDTAWRLLATGIVGPEDVAVEEAAISLIRYLVAYYPGRLNDRYGVEPGGVAQVAVLEAIGRNRGCLARGGEVDWNRAATLLLSETRQGVLGRLTLEAPA